MFALPDNRIVVYGGYCKEKIKGPKSKKSPEKGKIMTDMFLLVPDSKPTNYSGNLNTQPFQNRNHSKTGHFGGRFSNGFDFK